MEMKKKREEDFEKDINRKKKESLS